MAVWCAEVQALLLVYNDAVPALVSGTEGQLEGCVLIAGTGAPPPPSFTICLCSHRTCIGIQLYNDNVLNMVHISIGPGIVQWRMSCSRHGDDRG